MDKTKFRAATKYLKKITRKEIHEDMSETKNIAPSNCIGGVLILNGVEEIIKIVHALDSHVLTCTFTANCYSTYSSYQPGFLSNTG